MASPRTIHKIIRRRSISYDTVLDVIYEGQYEPRQLYNRTQVDVPLDLCVEVTTRCNLDCVNCFADCGGETPSTDLPLEVIKGHIHHMEHEIIRVSITGGEPLLHPDIQGILELPKEVAECGFVLSTNGTLRQDLDAMIAAYGWLVAISLHGNRETHNAYSRSSSYDTVLSRVKALAPLVPVHIYCVVSNFMTPEDVVWLYATRDATNAAFLRFIMPLPIGRYRETCNAEALRKIEERLDDRSGLKTQPSLTRFLACNGVERLLA